MALFGSEIKAAFKKATLWNVPGMAAANDGVLVLPSGMRKDITHNLDESLGLYFSKDGIAAPIKVEGDISGYLRYDGLDILLAMYMGTAGTPTQQGGTAAYAYTYKVNTSLDGLFGTYVKNMKNYVEEYPGVKISGVTIKGETGKTLQATFDAIASDKLAVNNPNLVAATVGIGAGALNAFYCPLNKRIYVSNSTDGTVSVINPETNTSEATINSLPNAAGIAYCPTNEKLYIGSGAANTVTVINPVNNSVVTSISITAQPKSVVYCPSNDRIYAAKSATPYGIAVIDPNINTVETTIAQAGTPSTLDMVYCPSNVRIYTANNTDGTVSVINPATNTIVATITVGAGARGIDYCPMRNNRIYVANFNDSTVSVINPANNLVLSTISDIANPYSIKYCPGNGLVYVGRGTSVTEAKWIDPITNAVNSRSIATGAASRFMEYCAHTNRIYIPSNTDSTVTVIIPEANSVASFASVTFFEEQNRIRYSEGVFRINTQGGSALGDIDKIYPASFELVSKRKVKGEYDGKYKTYYPNVQDLIDEPANDGIMETTLKLTFPRHTSSTFLAALQADTRYKADMTFTGAVIEGAYYRQFKVQFPHLQLKNVDIADAQGNIKEPLEFIVHGATAAPTGMSGLTDPFWISGINRRTTNPL